MLHSAFPVDRDDRQRHREHAPLLLDCQCSPSKTTLPIEQQSHPYSTPFPKKLFRRVPSCPSFNNLHKFPKKMSIKFRERLSLVQSPRASPVAAHHHDRHHDYRRDEDGTSPVPTLLSRESEDGINITPRTSTSESDSDDVTVVGCNERGDEDEGDIERNDALHKMRYRTSYRKILQHVPGFSDEEDDDVRTYSQYGAPTETIGINSRVERRHSLASPTQHQSPAEVFWGLRATPYHSRVDLPEDHHGSHFANMNEHQARTELRPPPWHKPRHTKMERTVHEEKSDM